MVASRQVKKYLGVHLNKTLGFRAHLRTAAARAQSTATALSRIMPNVGGATQKKRRLVATVVDSLLLYASPVWSGALAFQTNIDTILRPQRAIALRVATAYRTVSTAAILVIAGTIPAHHLAWERQLRYTARRELRSREADKAARQEVFRRWQEEWDNDNNGRWTNKLIRKVQPWVERRHGQVDFHLTQMLTGHGCFSQYLHRIGKLADPSCIDCQAAIDDAEHAIYHCDRWWGHRRRLESVLECDFTPVSTIDAMLESRGKWEAVREFANVLMATREEEERVRQREAAP